MSVRNILRGFNDISKRGWKTNSVENELFVVVGLGFGMNDIQHKT